MNDIEIYIKDPDAQAVEDWLKQEFDQFELSPSPNGKAYTGHGVKEDKRIPVKLFPNAVGKYASLCFDSEESPWQNDLDCARDAWKTLGKEVRCATGEWQEGSEVEDEPWWSLNEDGEQQIKWQV